MSELIGVWINCASEEEATRIAEEAVKRRLAACSNRRAKWKLRPFLHFVGGGPAALYRVLSDGCEPVS
jgi:hypothetical protein